MVIAKDAGAKKGKQGKQGKGNGKGGVRSFKVPAHLPDELFFALWVGSRPKGKKGGKGKKGRKKGKGRGK
jgi:hypothetical protein